MTAVHYFAYGANMSSAVLSRRGIAVLSREPGLLRGHRLVFDLPGIPWIEPAFAGIVPDPGHDTYGVLYRLAADQLERINSYESPGYTVIEVEVEGERSGRRRASTFRSKRSTAGLRPSRRYLRVLCEGARENALPASYVDELAAHPAAHVPILSGFSDKAIAMLEGYIRRSRRRRRKRSDGG
jgi:hypothetical protein